MCHYAISSTMKPQRTPDHIINFQRKLKVMLPLSCCSAVNVALFLLLACTAADGFGLIEQQPRRHLTTLNAIAIPHDSLTWSRATGSRKNRILHVLKKAQSRTGLANANVGLPAVDSVQTRESVPVADVDSAERKLPFTLPALSTSQLEQLRAGEIVQEQSEMGRQGSGFIVQDIEADEKTVWDCLLDFEAYTDNIHTVRSTKITETTPSTSQQGRRYNTASTTRASFSVSKFHLTISAILKYQPHKNGHFMELTLDNALSNAALQHAKGIWYTEVISPTVTRVWLLCDLTVSPLLPPFIVDSAATKAMPRASSWIRPTVAKRHLDEST